MDVQRKNGLDICNQQEKSYQNVELFYLGIEKVRKMQVSVINQQTNTVGPGKIWRWLKQLTSRHVKATLFMFSSAEGQRGNPVTVSEVRCFLQLNPSKNSWKNLYSCIQMWYLFVFNYVNIHVCILNSLFNAWNLSCRTFRRSFFRLVKFSTFPPRLCYI